jgi:hypothetical protein
MVRKELRARGRGSVVAVANHILRYIYIYIQLNYVVLVRVSQVNKYVCTGIIPM